MSCKSKLPALSLITKKGEIYGRVRFRGEDRWLGKVSEQMHLEYARVRAHIAEHGCLPTRSKDEHGKPKPMTVGELADLYEQHVESYYRKNGEVTSEVNVQKLAIRYLRDRAASLPAGAIGPLTLADCRKAMLAKDVSRKVVNGFVQRIRQCFRWGVAQQMVSPTVLDGLRAVDALKKGRTQARETDRVMPVDPAIVEMAASHVSRQIAAMMKIQLHSGMRPQEVRLLRWCEIDRSSKPWIYRPTRHKTQHHERDRAVPIGPKAREALGQFRRTSQSGFIFSPRDAEILRNRERSDARKVPKWASHDPEHRRLKRGAVRRVRDAYGADTYGRAIKRGCDKAKVPPFTPNQLRHTCLTEVRQDGGLEASQAVGGHATADVTQIYAERDLKLAMQVIERIG